MNEKLISPQQSIYLLKVIFGLIVLGGLVLAANELALSGLSPLVRYGLLSGLIIVAAAIVPIVRLVYDKMDELQRVLHQNACVASMSIIAAASAVIGILQTNELIPVFNQFWTLGMVISVWGISLLLADRRYK